MYCTICGLFTQINARITSDQMLLNKFLIQFGSDVTLLWNWNIILITHKWTLSSTHKHTHAATCTKEWKNNKRNFKLYMNWDETTYELWAHNGKILFLPVKVAFIWCKIIQEKKNKTKTLKTITANRLIKEYIIRCFSMKKNINVYCIRS